MKKVRTTPFPFFAVYIA